ncbi:lysine N(6)-hydroxylase/L-ornithine N(5)-oxygenase family protein [Streptomyces roseifaciens]
MSVRRGDTAHTGCGPIEDLVGIGFGPANLALAIAIDEHNRRNPGSAIRAGFLERQQRFGWHQGMLIEGATMQVSFLKDLVTMRDPGSRFSFLHYLQERGRLADFINQKTFFPTRVEFHDYFEWCAGEFASAVDYGRAAVALQPVRNDGVTAYVDVVSRSVQDPADESVRRTRNIVLGTGLTPRVPEGVSLGPHVWHNRDLLFRSAELADRPHRRFVVVGAGQSAAESAEYLHRTFPDAEVCAVFSRYGYSPADDSPFANRIFDPAAVDHFYDAPEDVKQALLGYHGNTNYSVVDGELIEQLYRTAYQEKVQGRERLRILNTSRLTAVEDVRGGGARAVIRSLASGEDFTLDCDAVVLATGYRPADPRQLLGELAEECLTDEQGRLRIDRDHRVMTTGRIRAGIYLQGGSTEHTHGITSTLLSTLAVRSGEICGSLLRGVLADGPAGALAGDGAGVPADGGSRAAGVPADELAVQVG